MNSHCIQSTTLYDGPIFKAYQEDIQLESGFRIKRDMILHDPAVVIIPIDSLAISNPTVYLVQQYRFPIKKLLWEFPAGLLNKQEDPLEGAKRELHEETGLSATCWYPLGGGYSAPGFTNEYLHFFLATDLTQGQPHTDGPDEEIVVQSLFLEVLETWVADGLVEDLKTLLGIQLLKARLA